VRNLSVGGAWPLFVSTHFMLLNPCVACQVEGDVIFTGTPSGVGEIEPGQIGTLKWGDKLEYQVQF